MQSLVNGHPLVDGNKRLGWLATGVFLELNDVFASDTDNDAVYELVYSVAEGSPTVDEIAVGLRRICSDTR
jgi:death-on-curing protein